jgi:hypothetical protein
MLGEGGPAIEIAPGGPNGREVRRRGLRFGVVPGQQCTRLVCVSATHLPSAPGSLILGATRMCNKARHPCGMP